MKVLVMAAIVALGAALSGCATVIKGSTQTINVSSPPVWGARCVLFNDDGNWDLLTPGAVAVPRSGKDMTVVCTKRGFRDARTTVSPQFNFVTFGNLGVGVAAGVAGLMSGLIIDSDSGANHSYPHDIEVPMEVAPKPPAMTLFTPTS